MSLPAPLGSRRRVGTEEEARAVYALLAQRSSWLRNKALQQWNPPYPVARFNAEVEAGHVWYWGKAGHPTATVTLYPTCPDYYPHDLWRDEVRAWYVARLAVAIELAGAKLGSAVLQEVELDAVRQDLQALRLDVAASNPFLEPYYVRHGFRRVALGDIQGEASIFLEKFLRA